MNIHVIEMDFEMVISYFVRFLPAVWLYVFLVQYIEEMIGLSPAPCHFPIIAQLP